MSEIKANEVAAHHRAIHSSADAARMAIASYLRELRTDLKWTQEELGGNARPSIGPGTISQMELGTYNGDVDKLRRVFKTLRRYHPNVASKLSVRALESMCQLYFQAGKVPSPE
jgi:hypothetical protein